MQDQAGRSVVLTDSVNAAIHVGTEGNEGDIVIYDYMGQNALHVDGHSAAIHVGADGNEGDVIVKDDAGGGAALRASKFTPGEFVERSTRLRLGIRWSSSSKPPTRDSY